MFKEKIIIEMKEVFKEIPFGIEHTLKVLKNAEDIMKGENIGEEEKEFISIIAILHDIGAVEAQKKYGSIDGVYQEKEGPEVAKEILKKVGYNKNIDRICFIIGNHHTPSKIDGLDFQIQWEADLLENLTVMDKEKEQEKIKKCIDENFKTNTGKRIAYNRFILVGDEDINLYYIVEAAVSKVSELMRYLRRNVRKADWLDMDSSEEWLKQMYDEWPISGRTLSAGRVLKKNAGEISLTILAEVFAWYHDDVDTLTIYTQNTDAHEFQTSAEQKLKGNQEFSPALDSPISVAFKSNDFILCQMYREGILTMDDIRQLRRDDRKLTYTKQRADKSVVCRKEVVTKEQFVELIQDATVQILF